MQTQDAVTMVDVEDIFDAVDGYIRRANPNEDFINHFSTWGKELGDVIKTELGIPNIVQALVLGIITDKTELGPIAKIKFSQFLEWLDGQGFKLSQ